MRTSVLVSFAVLLVLGLGVASFAARAEGEADSTARIAALEAQVRSLKADMDLLLSREATTTKYLLSMSQASSNLHTGVSQARTLGFEAAAIPADSRVAVARTMDKLAQDLGTGLPAPSKAEVELRRVAEDLRRQAFPK